MDIFASLKNLTKFEIGLWMLSSAVIIGSALLSGNAALLPTGASVIGVTALIFVAKGDVLGQILTVLFSLLYAVISYKFRYYGEMLTYLGMTAPIAMMAVISWLRHPFEKGRQEVAVNRLSLLEFFLLFVLTAFTTLFFGYILWRLDTPNIIPSTVSIATSFAASYLTFRRSRFYAIAYAANDLVLIILWVAAALKDFHYFPMVLCFSMFLLNDLYGFASWTKIQKKQAARLRDQA